MQRRAQNPEQNIFQQRDPWIQARRGTAQVAPSGQRKNRATISEEEQACKPQPPELTAGWMDGFCRRNPGQSQPHHSRAASTAVKQHLTQEKPRQETHTHPITAITLCQHKGPTWSQPFLPLCRCCCAHTESWAGKVLHTNHLLVCLACSALIWISSQELTTFGCHWQR